MGMSAVTHPYIEQRRDGTLVIAGTGFKLVHIVLDRLIHHWDADEIQRQHPHLTLAQIYSALAYYYDNQAEIDRLIDQRLRKEEEILESLPPTPTRAQLLTRKISP